MNSLERKELRYQRRQSKRLKNHKASQKSFDEVFNFVNLYKAGKRCCRGTRWKTSTINFETTLLTNIEILLRRLNTDYKYEGFTFFQTVEHGKMRDIHALSIRDRTVQMCYCNNLMTDLFAMSYTKDNCASLKGRGYMYAINRMTLHLRKHYKKYGLKGGVYQYDFKSYFASLPHDTLKQRISRQVEDVKLANLGKQFVDEFKDLQNQKNHDKGVGLGSPVSQNYALEYASPIDHYIIEVLHNKRSMRYMDDGNIIHHDISVLQSYQDKINNISNSMGIALSLNKCKIIPFEHHGFDYLKIRFRLLDNGRILKKISRRGIKAIRRKLKLFRQWVNENKFDFEDVATSYQSWRGYAKHFDSYRTLCKIDRMFVNLFKQELGARPKPFKCTLKARRDYEIGWIYYATDIELKHILDTLNKTRRKRYLAGFVPLSDTWEWRIKNASPKSKAFYDFKDILFDNFKEKHTNVHCNQTS